MNKKKSSDEKIIGVNWPLTKDQTLTQYGQNKVLIHNSTSSDYLLENPNIQFVYDKQTHVLRLNYLKQFEKHNKVNALLKTWRTKLDAYTKGTLYTYVVHTYYKHFPILVSVNNQNPAARTITVENFYGCKDSFIFCFHKLNKDIDYNSETKTLHMESYDDITTGNQLENLIKLRYRTNLKHLDRRVFTDGFFIKKYIVDLPSPTKA